jgi:hypothetical protein
VNGEHPLVRAIRPRQLIMFVVDANRPFSTPASLD